MQLGRKDANLRQVACSWLMQCLALGTRRRNQQWPSTLLLSSPQKIICGCANSFMNYNLSHSIDSFANLSTTKAQSRLWKMR
ncbi:hypothetical protein GN244_ATG17451 [Phytophthora infestans]|uniref:Uncharacterized protein n=1 Tax=Phytophthora infestans TaxID=4787 RepID=A0A833WEF7_PHYIN|nr:hypothetical protein GN244_ATG17451 [Phytophthora infestans]